MFAENEDKEKKKRKKINEEDDDDDDDDCDQDDSQFFNMASKALRKLKSRKSMINETTNPQPVQLQQKIFKSPKAAKPLQILVSLIFALDDLRAQRSERESRRFTTQQCKR